MSTKRQMRIANRGEILGLAHTNIGDTKQKRYGDPESNFQHIADLWNAYLKKSPRNGEAITSHDVGNMMVLLKVARSVTSPDYYDNYVDMAGYAALNAEIQKCEY